VPLAGSPVSDRGDCTGKLADQRDYGGEATRRCIVDDPTVGSHADGCSVGAAEAGAAVR